MIKFQLVVENPSGGDVASRNFEWPALPRKGEEIDICETNTKSAGGVPVVVKKVQHWFGCGDIDVHVKIVWGNKERDRHSFKNLLTDYSFNSP